MAGYEAHLAGGGLTAGGTGAVAFFMETPMREMGWISARFPDFSTWITQTWEGAVYASTLVAVCLLFSIWPDVDTDSKAQRIFGQLLVLGLLALIWAERFRAASMLGFYAALPMMGRHRGWTHTWWAMAVVPAPLAMLPYFYMPGAPWIGVPYYVAATAGYTTHLFIDKSA